MKTKLHAVTDTLSGPLSLFITVGQVSDHNGVLDSEWILANRKYDADGFRRTLKDKALGSAS